MTPDELRKFADRPDDVCVPLALRHAADEIERLQIPYCLGRTTIETVADEGQLALDSGHAFIAASDLFKHNPYTEIDRLNAELKSLREVENVTITILRERERRLAELAPLRDVAEAAKNAASGHPPFDEPRSFYRVPQNEMVLLVAALAALHAFQAKRGEE